MSMLVACRAISIMDPDYNINLSSYHIAKDVLFQLVTSIQVEVVFTTFFQPRQRAWLPSNNLLLKFSGLP